jgi:hypothetical protein
MLNARAMTVWAAAVWVAAMILIAIGRGQI